MTLHGLAPLVSDRTRLIVLGSFPGARSLAQQQYYAHPQNHFWKIFSVLWNTDLVALDYESRCRAAVERGLGVWDVYACCERQGSLDTSIRNAAVNDFADLARRCPQLKALAHNGLESFRHAPCAAACWSDPHAAEPSAVLLPALISYRLPSTSPANASWSFERKLAAWRDVLDLYGLA